MAGSSTGLNDAIEAAYKAGIPVVTISSSVTSPYAINVDSNYARWGYDMASAIKKALDGKGNVLMVEGIAGAPIVALERAGAEKAFKGSDIKEARSVNGNWTANVTKTAVLQALATTPQKIDAVWTTGSESRVVAEAFAEANRPQPLITGSISGDALGYWKAHPDGYRFDGQAVLPGWNSQALFRVAVRLLEGQQPKLGTLLIPIPAVHQDDLGQVVQGVHDAGFRVRLPVSADRSGVGQGPRRLLQEAGADQQLQLRRRARSVRRQVSRSERASADSRRVADCPRSDRAISRLHARSRRSLQDLRRDRRARRRDD